MVLPDMPETAPLILLVAGGTGGHLFPAEALGSVLMTRGYRVRLATDARAIRYSGLFAPSMIDVVPSATVHGRNPVAVVRALITLGWGTLRAMALIRRLRPAAVVGFGGYPTLPPLWAARWLRVPTVIHDANAVMGRANRLLADRANAIAISFPGVVDGKPALARKAALTGNPVRPAIKSAAAQPYAPPQPGGPLRVLVFGGSQGARIMADVVPPAIEQLDPTVWERLQVVQQVREEDMDRVRAAYARMKIAAELAPFFTDLPARYADCHLVIARAGAGTVAELSAVGRPSILVPLPGALDQDQFANAGKLEAAGGAIRIPQPQFTPERLAGEIAELAGEPARLSEMAGSARGFGRLDADERLADVVESVIRGPRAVAPDGDEPF
jgi:UDP-N-acetylglucosamine--N-acetylmuramyl-(pentapeptide) pyrophosphoryl-undecaprenol N-acetylglucosamine transferase